MSYTKTTWVNDSSPDINADNLNHIEQGIYDAHQGLMPEAPTDNKTYGRKNGAWSEVVTDVEWGDIGGDITEQTDLQTALGGKVDTSSMSAYRTATAEDVINATKADKTALDKTDRSLDMLWKLNKGQTWDFDVDTDTLYTKTVPSGAKYDSVDMVGGKSVVVNQLVDTATTEVTLLNGRKYYTVIGGTASIQTGAGTAVSVTGGTDKVVDLTRWFGTGNEPTTTADTKMEQVTTWLEENPSYNTGEIKSASVDEVEVVGKNLMYGHFLQGIINQNGTINTSKTYIYSEEFIPVVENTQYTISVNTTTQLWICEYDENKAIINRQKVSQLNSKSSPFTTIANTKYIRAMFGGANSEVTIANAESSAQLELGSTATAYAPHIQSQTFTIPNSVQTLEGYGQSNGTTYNYVDYAEKKYHYFGKYVDGVWTPAQSETITDISSLLTEGFMENFDVESGGTITYHNSLGDGYKLLVPATNEFIVKIDEVS